MTHSRLLGMLAVMSAIRYLAAALRLFGEGLRSFSHDFADALGLVDLHEQIKLEMQRPGRRG